MNEIQVLWLAVEQGDDDAIERLLREGADLEATDADGRAALHWAVDKGEDDLVPRLLAAGANPNAQTRDGERPLDFAAHIGLAVIAQHLLNAGAEIRPAMLRDRYWRKIFVYWRDAEQTKLSKDVLRVIRAHHLSRELLDAMEDASPSPSSSSGDAPAM